MDECDTVEKALSPETCDMGHGSISICSLPVELVAIICSLVRRVDLPAFLLASKLLNVVGTPRLYSKIELHDIHPACACFDTLNMSPEKTSFARDLAQFVRAIVIHGDMPPQPFEHKLAEVAPRLVNLQRLRSGETDQPAEHTTLEVLAATPHPELEILELELGTAGILPVIKTPAAVSLPCLPKLHSLRICALFSLSERQISVVHDVLAATSTHLHSLALSVTLPHGFLSILPSDAQFPSLKHVEVYWKALPHITAQMNHVRSLLVEFSPDEYDVDVLPSTSFPVLEEIACAHFNISAFLSPATEGHRSIHTVALDHASFERNGGRFLEFIPRWEDVAGALRCLKYSAVPIRHLRFTVTRVSAHSLARGLSEMKELESLLIILDSHPSRATLEEWGPVVLPGLPRLHTLRISDAVFKHERWDSRFWLARDVELQRTLLGEYARHAPALRLVAFTTEFEWEKGADGEWRVTEDVEAEVGTDPMENDWSSDSDWSDDAYSDETFSDESDGSDEYDQTDEDEDGLSEAE